MIRENTKHTSWILKKTCYVEMDLHYRGHINLHKNNEENHALESEEFTEGVDEEIHE